MVIAFDTFPLTEFYGRGIGNFILRFCENIILTHPNHCYLFWGGKDYLTNEIINKGITCDYDRDEFQRDISELICQYNPDFFVDFSPLWGSEHDVSKVDFKDTRTCCIIYDIIPYIMRNEYFCSDKVGFYKYLRKIQGLINYDYLFAISKKTAEDIKKVISINENSIKVINCASGRTIDKNKKYLNKYEEYWLFPTGDAPQKNTIRVIYAYIKASRIISLPSLVISGDIGEKTESRIRRLAITHNLRNKVITVGAVSDEEIDNLYSYAKWIVYPSLYEGFGMPVIEAFEHNKPLLTSKDSSMSEIAESGAIYVDPYDVNSIMEGMLNINQITDIEKMRFVENGKQRLNCYSWANTVSIFIDYILSEQFRKKELQEKKIIENESVFIKIDNNLDVAENERNIRSYFLLNKWMFINETGFNIISYFQKRGYKKVAIYGMGILSDRFILETRDAIEIAYGIDMKPWHIEDDFPVYGTEHLFEIVDVLVVTAIVNSNEFRMLWEKKVDFPIVTIEEIIEDLYRWYKK